ncbi:hypothetical protein GCM10017708_23540 [Arthrobacter citreus]
MLREGAAQGTQCRNSHQQVPQFQGPQGQKLRPVHALITLVDPTLHASPPAVEPPAPAKRLVIILPERRRQAKRTAEEKQEKKKKYRQKCLGLREMGNKSGMGPFLEGAPRAVLFDRDGTLVRDVPYNGNPTLVDPFPQAAGVMRTLRGHGIRTGVITNQSGIARGLLTRTEVNAVNARIQHLLGRFDVWEICPHGPGDGCSCRKPQPGMIHSACARLGLQPAEVAVIGDIGADMDAAEAAGARAVLVPTPVTRPEETAAAPLVAADLAGAVALLLDRP